MTLIDRPASGTDVGVSVRRAGLLTAARVAAQAVAFVWFLIGARMMSRTDFGVVGIGLTIMMVVSAIGDLGVSRSIVRHVAVDPSSLWAAFVSGLRWRMLGGVAVGAMLVVAAPAAGAAVPMWAVPLSVAISLASGITDLGYAALRSVGAINIEATLLVAERLAFLALGVLVLELGGGPAAVLGVYLLTNALSASIATIAIAVRGRHRDRVTQSPSMMDAEAMRTALIFAITSLAPRLGSFLLILWSTTTEVSGYVVAQRPAEVFLVLVATVFAVAHPDLRRSHVGGPDDEASARATDVTAALVACAGPLVALLVVAPRVVLSVLGGAGRFDDMATAARLVGVTIVISTVRAGLEILLLAQERAKPAVFATTAGAVVALAVGIPAASAFGATGAAAAVLAGEAVAFVGMAWAEPSVLVGLVRRGIGMTLAGLAAAVGLVVAGHGTPQSPVVAIAITLVMTVPAAVQGYRWYERSLVPSIR
jgi:O-antigen/teichoic acid export membrane protein